MPFSLYVLKEVLLSIVPRFRTRDWACEFIDGDEANGARPVIPMDEIEEWERYDLIATLRSVEWLLFGWFVGPPLAVRYWPRR